MKNYQKILTPLALVMFLSINVAAQITAFTYQGKLTDAGGPANGTYDFIFKLYAAAGYEAGTVTVNDLQVTDGVFTANLDLGSSPFTLLGASELEIHVRPGASTGAYTALAPRQPLTSAPYAVQSHRAAFSDDATKLGGVPAGRFVQTDLGGNATIGGRFSASGLDVTATTTNNGDNTATFRAPNIGPNISHLHYGTTGDWYIRSAAPTGKVVLQDMGGNVGIGTAEPPARLSVVGGGFAANALITDSNTTATTLDLGNSSAGGRTWRFQSVGSGDPGRVGNLELWNVGGNNALAVKPNGNVGIGTLAPNAALEVNGYTKLGSDAPSIRVKKLTGTTGAAGGGSASIPHGLDSHKILSVSVIVKTSAPNWYFWGVGPNHQQYPGMYFDWNIIDGHIWIYNGGGTSSSYLDSRPVTILITYEQ